MLAETYFYIIICFHPSSINMSGFTCTNSSNSFYLMVYLCLYLPLNLLMPTTADNGHWQLKATQYNFVKFMRKKEEMALHYPLLVFSFLVHVKMWKTQETRHVLFYCQQVNWEVILWLPTAATIFTTETHCNYKLFALFIPSWVVNVSIGRIEHYRLLVPSMFITMTSA